MPWEGLYIRNTRVMVSVILGNVAAGVSGLKFLPVILPLEPEDLDAALHERSVDLPAELMA